ncbi:MAG: hypothetical protein GY838_05780 [bacterium]|nr:hypothetical protein [bacterium]
MTTRASILVAACLLLVAAGCSTDTELGGVRVPNANPDTRITGQPPTLLEAAFEVRFYWTGTDPDGRIAGYQWKISDNGVDGISARDTLTVDPLTGAVVNPWRYTTRTDSIFVVLADQPGFPGDNPADPRSFRSHTLFVRTVDEDGAVDPTPAHISFTSTTIVPSARVEYPRLDPGEAQRAPRTINIGWSGYDEDFAQHTPTRARYLWIDAVASDGTVVDLWDRYRTYYEELIDFDSPDWSPWLEYEPDEVDRRASFDGNEPGEVFLFAVQVADTAGAVSVGRGYQTQVGNLFVADGFQPLITMVDPFLADVGNNTFLQIAAGQPLNFSWTVDASSYNGNIISMQHGWDLLSPDDPPDDPRWSVPPGTADINRFAAEQSFQNGAHTFWLRVIDDSNQTTIFQVNLEVIEYVDYAEQADLVVIDQVVDSNNQVWPDCHGDYRDQGVHRNAFWQFLENGPGGVDGLVWDANDGDLLTHSSVITYADIVGYKALMVYARYGSTQSMFSQFRPTQTADRFVWLTPYQERGGNLFLVGAYSMASFLRHEQTVYMTPVVFTSNEENWTAPNGTSYKTGFGTKELPNGTDVLRGPLMYPYAVAGIANLDWTSPSNMKIYSVHQTPASLERRADCVGLKGVVLDPDFRDEHAIGPGVVSDTVMTESCIDFRDERFDVPDLPIVTNRFLWRFDEFIDENLSPRSGQVNQQACEETTSPTGMCVEPMWRGYARFDWLREYKRANGEPNWPESYMPVPVEELASALSETCGAWALGSWEGEDGEVLSRGSAQTNGLVFGYFSYKFAMDKESQAADVYWGFDPYRFNHEKMKKAIRWVLSDHFNLTVLPD